MRSSTDEERAMEGRRKSSQRFTKQILTSSLLLAGACILASSLPARAQFNPPENVVPQGSLPEALRDIGIDQRLNEQLTLDLEFRDESGREVKLREYFVGKPVILALVYYTCPMLCNQELNGLIGTLKTLSFSAGREFNVVAVSFDPRDTPETAFAKKRAYVDRYQRSGAEAGLHFLTGDEKSIRALTEAVGFHYRFDSETNQYVHASGIMIATPEGKLSHYFYGIDYSPRDVRLGLVEASDNKIGSPVDQVLLFCYHYDPVTGKYGPVIMNIIRLGALLTFAGLAIIVFIMRRRFAARQTAPDAGL
jgi:protein SCO1/2